jgi:hypothetical protein
MSSAPDAAGLAAADPEVSSAPTDASGGGAFMPRRKAWRVSPDRAASAGGL